MEEQVRLTLNLSGVVCLQIKVLDDNRPYISSGIGFATEEQKEKYLPKMARGFALVPLL